MEERVTDSVLSMLFITDLVGEGVLHKDNAHKYKMMLANRAGDLLGAPPEDILLTLEEVINEKYRTATGPFKKPTL